MSTIERARMVYSTVLRCDRTMKKEAREAAAEALRMLCAEYDFVGHNPYLTSAYQRGWAPSLSFELVRLGVPKDLVLAPYRLLEGSDD